MKKEYWIIDTASPGESENSKSAVGPFATIASAEKWLRDDAKDTFLDADRSCRELSEDREWADPVHIVQVLRTVRQCPEVSVRVQLRRQ